MMMTYETFSPERAAVTLRDFNTVNRALRPAEAEKKAADMRAGKWTQCVAPIVFYDDGSLADGQHRLTAVMLSGTTQNFYVLRGLPRAEGLNVDRGVPRTLVDNARISGTNNHLSNVLLSVVRGIEDGAASASAKKPRSDTQRLQLAEKHREAAEWALKHTPRGKLLRNAIVISAIGRAWYWESDKERLARFSEVLSSGFADGEKESAAIALRNYLLAKGPAASLTTEWRSTFLKSQNAINYFMRGRRLHVIKALGDEVYPLKDKHMKAAA